MNRGIEDLIDFYADSWIGGDRNAVRHLLAPGAEIEWNLDLPVDDEELVQTLNRIALFADGVQVVSKACNDDGAALVYDCAAPFGTARMAEFLVVDGGRITRVRQVYDTVAINRFFPGLVDDEQ
jgi:ketosteroid isomerase-like protein